jgi:predicted nicotinamide N-methyase
MGENQLALPHCSFRLNLCYHIVCLFTLPLIHQKFERCGLSLSTKEPTSYVGFFMRMTDYVTFASHGGLFLQGAKPGEGSTRVQNTRRYSALEIAPRNASLMLASFLSSAMQTRPRPQLQSGWQREVGFVPQSAFSEGLYTFSFKDGRTLSIPESFEAIGSRVWDCAPSMARWFEKGDFVRGKKILELGAGTGLLGLACATLGASTVVLTDLPSILPSMQRSIKATGLGSICEARALDWNDADAVARLRKDLGPFDMIVASDVLVFAVDASTTGDSGLVRALTQLADRERTEILMGCNKNRHGFLVGFYEHPPHHLFDISVVSKDEVDIDYYTEMLMLYRMYLK